MDFEYTAPGMPQQNGHVEQKFATLINQVHTIPGLWTNAANTTMLLKNNLLTPNRTLAHFNNFWDGKEKHHFLLLQALR